MSGGPTTHLGSAGWAPGAGLAGLRGVLLDVDDTLVDTRAAFAAAIGAVAERFVPGLPRERHPELVARWRADEHGWYASYTRGERSLDDQRRRRADELFAAFGGPRVDDDLYPEWLEIFLGTFEASWRAHDDARAAVSQLVAHGLRLGAVTNAARAMQARKLAVAGLADDVPLLVDMETFGVGKPDPRVFLEGCRLLGLDPGEVAYVGDELGTDAIGAAEAGLVGVWLDRPGTRRGGSHLEDPGLAAAHGVIVVDSLPALVARIGAAQDSAAASQRHR